MRSNQKDGMRGVETADHVLWNLKDKRVYIETYGCRYNFGDTAKLWEILRGLGCSRATDEDDADAVVINTCTVVAATEQRMLRRLSRIRNQNLYVTGCMSEVQRDAIMAVCTPVVISQSFIREQHLRIRTLPPDSIGIVQIAQGCTGSCTYCITRTARGPLRSAHLPEILEQVSAYARMGAVEIQLTAQDAGAWGRDIGLTLPDLLHSIDEIEGGYHIRVGMMNPAMVIGILDQLVEAFSSDCLFRVIHLPVQSGSDRILRQMGRGYRIDDFEQIVAAFRRRFPDISILTDMIVGFPGETEEDFARSSDLVRRMRFNKVNVTRYSRRPGTPAYPLKDTLDAVKKDRSRRLLTIAEEISTDINSRYLHRSLPFVVTERIRQGSVMARTDTYLGVLLPEDLPMGLTGTAEIRQAGAYFLRGKRIPYR